MKLLFFAGFLISNSAIAATFDTERFGSGLNGWHRNRTAVHAFANAKYRTHEPTVTATPTGGIFLSTQVDLLSAAGAGTVCHIELVFTATGFLESARIKGIVGGKDLDTGLVLRPQPPAPAEGAVPRPFYATDEMISELFTAFDAEMKKVSEGKDTRRRDLISRIAGATAKTADLSARLRHNVNLLLRSTR